MRVCIIAGGPHIYDAAALVASSCDRLICADSGADFALSHGLLPDLVVGDMDSISQESLEQIKASEIPLRLFPVKKDKTDTELAFDMVDEDDEILLVCTIEGRIDHVMANMQISMKQHMAGRKISMTDGVTDIIPLSGPETVCLDGLNRPDDLSVSLILADMNSKATGVSTRNLSYALEDATIEGGSSLTVSNCPIPAASSIGLSVKQGELFLIVTDKHS